MEKSINAIRVLSMDMIQRANSGHPGICMGAAPIMYCLFKNHLIIDHDNDKNSIRDRFVLSAGHGSAMLYATLYLSELFLSKEDLQNFRQLDSKTPGHPEITHTKFVDSTSGPLGQGIAQAVGMAVAQKHNAAKFNVVSEVVDNYTYVLCGDGDLQEGVSHEASSLAGHLKLNKLIVIWDSNDIQLDNPTEIAVSENICNRYKSYGFDVLTVKDGENIEEINNAIIKAKESLNPVLIEVKTKIGYGSPNFEGKTAAHGAPLGEEEIKKVKETYLWDLPPFEVDKEIFKDFSNSIKERFFEKSKQFSNNVLLLKDGDEELYNEYIDIIQNKEKKIVDFSYETLGKKISTRVASGVALNEINLQVSNLFGGSADLSKSNNSFLMNSGIFSAKNPENKNIAFGVREFGMAAIVNGINLYGMNIGYAATFFVFSDYLKAAIRMSAIQNIPSIYILTHDSIAVGEDGPTHEPIEQITGIRAIPNVNVIRPCDSNETKRAYEVALSSKDTPTILVLSRQDLEVVSSKEKSNGLIKGAYVIADEEEAQRVIIASGSEVKLALEVKEKLKDSGILARVISMPCTNLFEKQSEKYKEEILLKKKVQYENTYFIEMSTACIGYKYAKNVFNITTFGKSGKGSEVIEDYKFTVDNLYEFIKN